ncbi:50S ribosomal protein L24 [Parapedobacter sp. GCM10030251]|uniref:50S ribosomal protein L24 n=1 Tax=Parapedobacter sp. GCM10030251 TaxID=3273419 RepID=UPI00361B5A35
MKIRTGDLVKVLSGNSKGAQGKVLEIIKAENRAVVEGVNIVKKHTKPSAANPNGGIVEKEAPIHISNLALIDPKGGKPTRVGRKVIEVNGKKKIVRVAKKSGEVID